MNDDILLKDNLYENSQVNHKEKSLVEQLTKFKEENKKLQYQLNLQSAKESLHNTTMEKIKQIQEEFDKAYQRIYCESKERENEIKEQYNRYSIQLQSDYQQKESVYQIQIDLLKKNLSIKNDQIKELQDNIEDIINKNSKKEMTFSLKQKQFEETIQSKEKRLIELEQTIKTISYEAQEKIESLSEKLITFESQVKSGLTIEAENGNANSQQETKEHDNNNNEDNNADKKETIEIINERGNSLCSLKSTIEQPEECCNKCNDIIQRFKKKNESLQFENKKLFIENKIKDKEKEKAMFKSVKRDFQLCNHSKKTEQLNSFRIKQLETEMKDYELKKKKYNDYNSSLKKEIEVIDNTNKGIAYHNKTIRSKFNNSQRYYSKMKMTTNESNTSDIKVKAAISRNLLKKNILLDSCNSVKNNKSSFYANKSTHLSQSANSLRKLNSKIDNLKKIIRKTELN